MAKTRKTAQRRKRRMKGAESQESRDELLEAALEQGGNIVMMYKMFEDKRPVMLFDIQEQRIYAYPYKEFCATLSEKSQASLKEQYEQAQIDGRMVVFVRDNVKQKLRSFSLDYE